MDWGAKASSVPEERQGKVERRWQQQSCCNGEEPKSELAVAMKANEQGPTDSCHHGDHDGHGWHHDHEGDAETYGHTEQGPGFVVTLLVEFGVDHPAPFDAPVRVKAYRGYRSSTTATDGDWPTQHERLSAQVLSPIADQPIGEKVIGSVFVELPALPELAGLVPADASDQLLHRKRISSHGVTVSVAAIPL